MRYFNAILVLALLVIALRIVMLMKRECPKRVLFALINVTIIGLIYRFLHLDLRIFVGYVAAIICFYGLTRWLACGRQWLVPTLSPIMLLIGVRYFSPQIMNEALIGLSYMVFRLSQLVVIVRNRVVPMPSLWEYIGFSFFPPTMFVGPISSYSTFITSLPSYQRSIPVCILRIAVGATKYFFLCNVIDRLTYSGLLLDGHAHPPIDLVVAAVAYYFYLYCNFSGFCDVMIGVSGLVGIKVSENFDRPYLARNMKDFWNRWHITLSTYMRDMFFAPVSKALIIRVPESMSSHAIALTISMVFILIGLWHGRAIQFFLFGVAHAAGVVSNFYYGLFLKKHLSKERLRAYNQNRLIHVISVAMTFSYVCFTLFLFANTPSQMVEIFKCLQ